MSSRRRIRTLLGRAFDGTLDADGWLELEDAARRDPRVATELERDRALVEALERLDDPESEPFDLEGFAARLEARLDREDELPKKTKGAPRRVGWPLAIAFGAAAAAATIAVLADLGAPRSDERDDGASHDGPARGPVASVPEENVGHGTAEVPDEVTPFDDAPFAGPFASPAVTLASDVPDEDPERRAAAAAALDRALLAVALPAVPTRRSLATWRDAVRSEFEGRVGGARNFVAIVRRRADEIDAQARPELAVAASCLVLANDDAAAEEFAAARLASGGADAEVAFRSAVLCGATRALAVATGRGDVDARDVVDAYRAYPPEFADERVREYALELVRGAWSEIDRAEFDALAEAVPGLAESFVDEALSGRRRADALAFLRGDTAVADVLLSRIVEATRSVERDRLLGAIGAVGAGDALRWVEARCRARDEAAYDALVSLPGEAALLAWLDAQEDASPQRRAALWQHVLDVRSDELLAVVDRIDASTPEFETIVEGAMLVGDERAAAVLLACAARPDVRAAERANWVEAASEFGRHGDVDALATVADLDPSDARLQAACLYAVWIWGGLERAATWCEERFSDVRPLDALERGASAPRAVRSRLRAHLSRIVGTRSRA